MIRRLTAKDQKIVLDFVYQRERENLFVIGSFVINAQSRRVIQSLTDYAIKQGIKIKQVPCFQKYGEDVNKPIQPFERARIDPKEIFILKIKGKIRSRANPHGYSKSYFQIGGVGTAEKHRGKGYAKQVVSALCRHYFNRGLKYALLFTANDNVAAQKVYKTLGFKAVDKFFIAKY